MKSLLIFAFAIATLFSGTTGLECYYCHGHNCDTADPSTLQVETCYTGGRTHYEGEVELSTTEGESDAASTTVAAESEGDVEAVAETTASSSASRSTVANAAAEISTEAAASSTTASTTTTKKPCDRPSWFGKWSRGLKAMCINSTSNGFFGLGRKVYRGCYYTRKSDPCRNLLGFGLVKSCKTCTGDLCN